MAKDGRLRAERRVSEVSDHRCECGCGRLTMVIPKSDSKRGWVKGEPRRFVRGHGGGGGGGGPVDYVVNALVGCWVWQRGVNEKGYGVKVADGQRRKKAHRWFYEQHVGAIPEGWDVHHRCGNRRCVNPAHLEAVAPSEHRAMHEEARRAAC